MPNPTGPYKVTVDERGYYRIDGPEIHYPNSQDHVSFKDMAEAMNVAYHEGQKRSLADYRALLSAALSMLVDHGYVDAASLLTDLLK